VERAVLTVAVAMAVVASVYLAVAGLLLAAALAERARARVVARQIRLTDAIHRELGAVAAPVVDKRPLGPWVVRLTVPAAAPATAGAVAAVVHRALASEPETRGARIVLALDGDGEAPSRAASA
jgi:hypothetical protein